MSVGEPLAVDGGGDSAPRTASLGRSLLAAPGTIFCLLLLALALLAPWLAPQDPSRQLDPVASRYRPPGTVLQEVRLADGEILLADAVRPAGDGDLVVERLGTERRLDGGRVVNRTAEGVADRRRFLLGTDGYGRDLLSRLLYGARVSTVVATLALLLALTVGMLVGAAAALGPRWLDTLLMRGVDALLSFPRIFLILLLVALLEPSTLLVVLVVGLTGWMSIARILRAELLSLEQKEHILAARGLGVGPLRLLTHHLLPNALTPVVVQASLTLGHVLLAEAALSYLGLGVQPPTPSWGNMVADGRSVLTTAWWVATVPGFAIVLVVLSFNLWGDQLRDLLDPRTSP